jgi:hypothetical protein
MMPATHIRLRLRQPARLLAAFAVALCPVLGGGVASAAVPDGVRGLPGPHEFRLGSGAAPFGRSTALLVTAQDVDQDRHLDLVVTSPLRHEVVGIWLNDGTGRFEQADLPRGPPILPSRSRLNSTRAAASRVSTLAPGWRAPVVHLTAGLVVRVDPGCARLRASAAPGRCFFLQRARAPRAPPARLL